MSNRALGLQKRALLLLLVVCETAACHKSTDCPESDVAPDTVATALAWNGSEHHGRDRHEVASQILDAAKRESQVFVDTGNTYVHYDYAEPPLSCLEDRTCFGMYRGYQEARQKELGAASRSTPREINALAAHLDMASLRRLASAQSACAVRSLRARRAEAANGESSVWLLDTGHPSERKRDAALAAALSRRSLAIHVEHVTAGEAPVAFEALGHRLTAAVLIGGELVKDITREDQWLELLVSREAVPVRRRPHSGIRLFDSHVHVVGASGAEVAGVLDRNGVERAVIMAMPEGADYAGITGANRRVLALAAEHPGRLVPLFVLNPNSDDPRRDLDEAVREGARGVKLLTGHGDYVTASSAQLDSPAMREVFRYCEQNGLPVLWHVNTHLYASGFLRVLRDFPRLTIIAPHFGGYLTYAPAIARQLVQTYPNLYFDISLGMQADYVRWAIEDLSMKRTSWRQLLLDYPDRFLFGTDLVLGSGASFAYANMVYDLEESLLESNAYDLDLFSPSGSTPIWGESHHRQGLEGLDLPEDTLDKILWANSVRIFGDGR